eukprot:COSAG04_NODE_224_length_19624_cov_47.932855_18_plen_370_part_00
MPADFGLLWLSQGMFGEWEALRKHLTEGKTLDTSAGPLGGEKGFSYIWTGPDRGGNTEKDFTQKYYERRETPAGHDRKADRRLGGGGLGGMMAHCAALLQREHGGLYEQAKALALAEVATSVQLAECRAAHGRAEAEHAQFVQECRAQPLAPSQPEARKRQRRLKRLADSARKAAKHVDATRLAQHDQRVTTWMARNRGWYTGGRQAVLARAWLRAKCGFDLAQVGQVERLMSVEGGAAFDLKTVKGLDAAELREQLAGAQGAAAPAAVSPAAFFPAAAAAPAPAPVAAAVVAAPAPPPPPSTPAPPPPAATAAAEAFALSEPFAAMAEGRASLTRDLSCSANDEGHRSKRTGLSHMSSKTRAMPQPPA